MATGPIANQGKGKFLRVYLESHPAAKVEDISAAWRAEGHEDGISGSLVSKIRSELGLTGKSESNGKSIETPASPSMEAEDTSSQKAKGKKTTTEEIAPQTVQQEERKKPSKSAFILEVLDREPGANLKKVNEAWASAGHEDQISPSVFFKAKRERSGKDESPPIASKPEPVPSHPEVPTPKAEKATKPAKAAAPARSEVETPEPKTAQAHASSGHGPELHQIEGEIDELMFRLKGLGSFADVQDALRTARRLLVRSHPH